MQAEENFQLVVRKLQTEFEAIWIFQDGIKEDFLHLHRGKWRLEAVSFFVKEEADHFRAEFRLDLVIELIGEVQLIQFLCE